MRQYLDFDLAIEPVGGPAYVARVLRSPAGEAESTFDWPFSPQDLEIFILRIGNTRRGTRRSNSPEMQYAKEFGRTLFDTVFQGPARTCLIRSLDEAERQDAGLRIRLHLGSLPQLNDVPWEYLYSDDLNRFLIVSTETPIVRYIDLQRRVRPIEVDLPLHILAVVSAPADLDYLDVEGEWDRLREALAPLETQLKLDRLEMATLEKLQERLRRDEVHVLHFIGHGAFVPGSDEGVLYFTNARGASHAVTGEDLGTILHDHRALRLVVLNSCEGARSDPADPFSGSAAALVGQGIPAVIAMQFEITDKAALTIAKNFYGSLADGYAVDAALAEARKAIFSQDNDVEWGTPVLYMRSPDGQLFDIDTATMPASPPDERIAERAILLSEAKAAASNAEWGAAISKLEQLLAEVPDLREAQDLLEEGRRHQLALNLYRGAGFLAAADQWDAVLERFRDLDALDVDFDDPDALREKAVAAIATRRRTERIAAQLERARAGLADSEWGIAREAAEAVLAEDPDHDEAQRIITEAQDRAAVAERYDMARTAAAAGQWDQVLKRFEEIDAIGLGYLDDIEQLRERATAGIAVEARRRDLDDRYEGAIALIDAEQWEQALATIEAIAADAPGYRGVERLRERVAAEVAGARRAADQADAGRRYADAIKSADAEDWPAVVAALDEIDEIAPGFGDPERLRAQATAATSADRAEPGRLEPAETESPSVEVSAETAVPVRDDPRALLPAGPGLAEAPAEGDTVGRSPLSLPMRLSSRRIPAWMPGALIFASADLRWDLDWWGDWPGELPLGAVIGNIDGSVGILTIRWVLLVLGALIAIQPYRYHGRPIIRRVGAALTVGVVAAVALSAALSEDIPFARFASSAGPWLALIAASAVVRRRLPSFIGSPLAGGPLVPGSGRAAVVAVGSIAVLAAAWLPWHDESAGFDISLTESVSLGAALTVAGVVALVTLSATAARKLPPPSWLGVVGIAVFLLAVSIQTGWRFVIDPWDLGAVGPAVWVAAFGGLMLGVGHRFTARTSVATAILFLFGFLVWSQTGNMADVFWSNVSSDGELLTVGLVGLAAGALVAVAVTVASGRVGRPLWRTSWTRPAVTIALSGLASFAFFAYGESRFGSDGGYWASFPGSILTTLAIAGVALWWARSAGRSAGRRGALEMAAEWTDGRS